MQLSFEELSLLHTAVTMADSQRSNIPVAAILALSDGHILGRSTNSAPIAQAGALGHAECQILESMRGRPADLMAKSTMYVTLEPCPSCAWIIRTSRVGRVIFATANPSYGAAGSVYDLLRAPAPFPVVESIGPVGALIGANPIRKFFGR